MRSFVRLALAAFAVASVATATQAAVLNFSGQTAAGTQSPFALPGTFDLFVDYGETTNSSGGATNSTFLVDAAGGGRLDYGHVSTTLAFGKSGTSDTLTISGTFGAVTVGQPPLGVLSLVLTRGGVGTTALALNSTNVNNMLQAGTTYTGSFFQRTLGSATPIATAQFSGTIPVPEPGSIGLLAGLGLVCGRRVWRRRQQKQAAAV